MSNAAAAFNTRAIAGSVITLGVWSAVLLFVGGVLYAITVAAGMIVYGLSRPIEDPVLGVMEILTLCLAPLVVVMMVAVHTRATDAFKATTLIAVVFAALLACVTTVVHFVQLTALRQTGPTNLVWPSPLYAAELLAWDVFLGLSLLFAAPAFRGDRLQRMVRTVMQGSGVLCILGVSGPASGEMRLQFVAVVGYGLLFPIVCLLVAAVLRRSPDAVVATS